MILHRCSSKHAVARFQCLSSSTRLPYLRTRTASRTPATAAVPAAAAAEEPDRVVSSDQRSSSDRKPPRPAKSDGPKTVVQTGSAVSGGALPDVLAATFPSTFPTLSAVRRVIRKDLILVDGHVGSCKTEVSVGQQLQQLELVGKSKGPRVVSLEVAYEDDDVAVVHKPWGVKMYSGDGRRTITGALRAGALKPSQSPDALTEPKPVHRLDAAVGGLLVIAKTASAVANLSQQFVERKVHKVYHALLSGRLDLAAAAATAASDMPQQQQQQPEPQQGLQMQHEASSIPSATSDEDEPLDSQTDAGEQLQDMLPLPELLQRQLQGNPPFTTSASDLGDPVLLEPETAAAASAADLNSTDNGVITPDSTDASFSSSSSSSSSGTTSVGHQLGPGVHVIDMPLEGKPCYSLYKVLGYSQCSRFGGWLTTVALSPVTGRKHQLRRHMAALGHPIVGDGKYALSKEDHISNQGIYLESLEVSFAHPTTGEHLHVNIKEPARFATLRQQQHSRWRKLSTASVASNE